MSSISRQRTGLKTDSAVAVGRFAAWGDALRAAVSISDWPRDFPNTMARPEPSQPALPGRPWILAALVLLTLLPRAIMAWKLNVLCADGVTYIQLADALQRGDWYTAFNMLQLNVYPMILLGLHKLGLGWELAGRLWGVTAATLTVVPLFGWTRRQFDDRVAVVACLLYAIHPELIEWTPELVRDPTFWLFFTSSMYFIWRATSEVRPVLFVAAGITIGLATLTRFEGWFLFVPLIGWTVVRFFGLKAGRGKLLAGAIACPLVVKIVPLAFQLFWISQGAQFDAFRSGPLLRAANWVTSLSNDKVISEAEQAALAAPATPVVALPLSDVRVVEPTLTTSDKPAPARNLWWAFVHIMERGLTPFHGLLFFGGYFAWLGIFNRRDNLVLTMTTTTTALAIWIHLWDTSTASSRYVLSVVIMSMPCTAFGLLSFSRTLSRLAVWLRMNAEFAVRLALPACLLVLGGIGWTDALTSEFSSRVWSAQLGQWIRGHYDHTPSVWGANGQMALVGYYSGIPCLPLPIDLDDSSLVARMEQEKPDVVVLWGRRGATPTGTALVEAQARLGLEQVEPIHPPKGPDKFVILARHPRADQGTALR